MFVKVVILLVGLSTAYALKCYSCFGKDCTIVVNCTSADPSFDRCSTTEANGLVIKACMWSHSCIRPIKCCSTDLCNGAVLTSPTVALLLLSSAIFTLFL